MNKKLVHSKRSQSGFTLLETMAVLIMVGILAAMAIPSYLGLLNRQRLNTAQRQVYEIMRSAQANTKREKVGWAACFYDDKTRVLWSINRLPESSGAWDCTKATNWEPLIGENSKLIAINSTYTTLRQNPSSSGYYRVRFRFDGALDTVDGGAGNQKGKIALAVRNEPNGIKRCVVVSTLLGALRTDKDNDCTR